MELFHLFQRVNLPYLGIGSSGCIDAGICAVVRIYTVVVGICIYCVWYYTTYKSGRYFTYPKKRSLGCTLDLLRSEEQQPLNDSPLSNLAVKERITKH